MADSSNTSLDLDAIEERANAATEGPWYCESDGIYDRYRSYLVLPVGNSDQDDADAAFIAAARDDVPSLVAEVRRLRADSVERPAVERLVAALRVSEWCEVFPEANVGDFVCGACGNVREHGHDDGCEVLEALAEFGQQPTGDEQ